MPIKRESARGSSKDLDHGRRLPEEFTYFGNIGLFSDSNQIDAAHPPQWTQGIPIEVVAFAYAKVLTNLVEMGSQETLANGKPGLALRMAKMKAGPVVTDNANFIIDAPFPAEMMARPAEVSRRRCWMRAVADCLQLLQRIKMLTGVVEVGLFCDLAKGVYFGNEVSETFPPWRLGLLSCRTAPCRYTLRMAQWRSSTVCRTCQI